MSRSFTVECTALGLEHLASTSNEALSAALASSLKDFSSRLRKKAKPPIPHHQAVRAVSNAAGFPGWEAFVSAARRLADTPAQGTHVRDSFCDTLPLLVAHPDFHALPEARRVFDTFVKRVNGHSGYPKELVEAALAEHWGETSYQAMLDRSAPESATFIIQVSGDGVWPDVVGPLRELLEDKERNDATSAAVRISTLRDAKDHAATLEEHLRALRRHAPEEQQRYVHAKTLKELPWNRPPAHEKNPELCVAYSYWRFCKDVAGKSGSRTWQQFERRAWQGFGQPSIALRAYPLKTTVPCPACGKPSSVEVVCLPSAHNHAEKWTLQCECGHRESRSGRFSALQDFAGDSAFVLCDCPGCSTRRQTAAQLLAPFSNDIERRLVDRLLYVATLLEAGEAGLRDVQLTSDGEVQMYGKKTCAYREELITKLPHRECLIGKALKDRTGGYLWPTPLSKYLEAEKGFLRKLQGIHLKSILSYVFDYELKAHFPQCLPGDEERERSMEAENRKDLNLFLAGFSPTEPESFRQWLMLSRTFVGRWWLAVPAITVVAYSQEAFEREMSRWSKRTAPA